MRRLSIMSNPTTVMEYAPEGDPIQIGDEIFKPNSWRRERILSMHPITKDDKKMYRVSTDNDTYELNELSSAPDYLLVIDEEPACVVSKRYDPVTHYDIVASLQQVLEEQKITPIRAKLWTWDMSMKLAVYVEDIEINDDEHQIGMAVFNSMDKKGGYKVSTYLERMICTNGLMASAWSSKFSRKHTARAGSIGQFRDMLEEAIKEQASKMSLIDKELRDLVTVPMSDLELTQAARSLDMRKWELEATKRFAFEFPLAGEGFVHPVTDDYNRWDALVDFTAVAQMNRDENDNLLRANYLEENILQAITR